MEGGEWWGWVEVKGEGEGARDWAFHASRLERHGASRNASYPCFTHCRLSPHQQGLCPRLVWLCTVTLSCLKGRHKKRLCSGALSHAELPPHTRALSQIF